MKTVLAIYKKDGTFHQYLMLSEARFISQICQALGEVTVKITELSISQYKHHFGK